MSTIDIEIPTHAGIQYIYMSRKIRGILLRASATYCIGVACALLGTALPDHLPKGRSWVKDFNKR